jgi:hypothetical protein
MHKRVNRLLARLNPTNAIHFKPFGNIKMVGAFC